MVAVKKLKPEAGAHKIDLDCFMAEVMPRSQRMCIRSLGKGWQGSVSDAGGRCRVEVARTLCNDALSQEQVQASVQRSSLKGEAWVTTILTHAGSCTKSLTGANLGDQVMRVGQRI